MRAICWPALAKSWVADRSRCMKGRECHCLQSRSVRMAVCWPPQGRTAPWCCLTWRAVHYGNGWRDIASTSGTLCYIPRARGSPVRAMTGKSSAGRCPLGISLQSSCRHGRLLPKSGHWRSVPTVSYWPAVHGRDHQPVAGGDWRVGAPPGRASRTDFRIRWACLQSFGKTPGQWLL